MSQDNWPPEKNLDERCMKELDFLLQVSLYYKSWANFDRYNNYIASIIRFRHFCKRQRTVFYTSYSSESEKNEIIVHKSTG